MPSVERVVYILSAVRQSLSEFVNIHPMASLVFIGFCHTGIACRVVVSNLNKNGVIWPVT